MNPKNNKENKDQGLTRSQAIAATIASGAIGDAANKAVFQPAAGRLLKNENLSIAGKNALEEIFSKPTANNLYQAWMKNMGEAAPDKGALTTPGRRDTGKRMYDFMKDITSQGYNFSSLRNQALNSLKTNKRFGAAVGLGAASIASGIAGVGTAAKGFLQTAISGKNVGNAQQKANDVHSAELAALSGILGGASVGLLSRNARYGLAAGGLMTATPLVTLGVKNLMRDKMLEKKSSVVESLVLEKLAAEKNKPTQTDLEYYTPNNKRGLTRWNATKAEILSNLLSAPLEGVNFKFRQRAGQIPKLPSMSEMMMSDPDEIQNRIQDINIANASFGNGVHQLGNIGTTFLGSDAGLTWQRSTDAIGNVANATGGIVNGLKAIAQKKPLLGLGIAASGVAAPLIKHVVKNNLRDEYLAEQNAEN